jgi:hypothetical protein
MTSFANSRNRNRNRNRSRVHVQMPVLYKASKGIPKAPQQTGNNECKSWGLVDRFGGVQTTKHVVREPA